MMGSSSHLGRTVKHLRRYRHIAAVLLKYGFTELGQEIVSHLHLPLRPPSPVAQNISRPQRLHLALEELGPTFVKLGQLLSTRPDLLSPPYIEELEKLQDHVGPQDFASIRREVELQLKAPIGELFTRFDEQPLAAGSIAQVHYAETPQGDRVAVKVRRSGIVEMLQTECEILDDLAALLRSTTARQDTVDPRQLVRQFTQTVAKESDLTNELHNIQRFQANFAQDAGIHIVRTYEEYCASGVLTMEYIEGVKPNDLDALRAAGLDPQVIARRGAGFVLKQVFDFGLFHSDPHPGNFLVLSGNVLAPLDFGQVARLTQTDRYLVGELVQSIVDQDATRMVRAFRRANMFSPLTDAREVASQLDDMLEVYHNLPIEQVALGRMMVQTFDLLRANHVHPPPEFTMMLKSIMTIEGLAMRLDPQLRLIEMLEPYARRLSLEQISPRRLLRQGRRALRESLELAASLPEDVSGIVNKLANDQLQMHVHHEHLESLINAMDKGSNRISFGLIIAALVVGSSILVTQEHGTVLGLMRLQSLGTIGFIFAGLMGIWLLISIMRSGRV